jgi:NAD(P)-dependent dehydrogenase (short-subunit alcohol dehydrogenase family)
VIALVTGASSGIGAETARILEEAGNTVIRATRADGLDLADLAAVESYADKVLALHDRIDVLVNNAGVMACPFGRTADGFEMQFGTNHLGHFLLTCLLAPAVLAAAPGARIVNVTSRGHQRSDIHWDDPNYERRPYDKWEAYGQSKTANILFTVELERRLAPRGIHAYAVHPGVISTNLSRHLDRSDFEELRVRARSAPPGAMTMKSIEEGAATTIYAATSPDLAGVGGVYLADGAISDEHAPWALDADAARRLWALSEQLVGRTFDVGLS